MNLHEFYNHERLPCTLHFLFKGIFIGNCNVTYDEFRGCEKICGVIAYTIRPAWFEQATSRYDVSHYSLALLPAELRSVMWMACCNNL